MTEENKTESDNNSHCTKEITEQNKIDDNSHDTKDNKTE